PLHTPSLHDALPIYRQHVGTHRNAQHVTDVLPSADKAAPNVGKLRFELLPQGLVRQDDPILQVGAKVRRLGDDDQVELDVVAALDRKSTRLNSSHVK